MPQVHRHRASASLRQTNKKHKANSASKRSIHRNAGGKVGSNKASTLAHVAVATTQAKAARLLLSKQKREQSKTKLLERRRLQGKSAHSNEQVAIDFPYDTSSSYTQWSQLPSSVVPRVVGIISLSKLEDILEDSVRAFLMQEADVCFQDGSGSIAQFSPSAASFTVQFRKMKKDGHVTLLTNSSAFRPHYYKHNSTDDSFGSEVLEKEDASVLAALDLCRVCDLVIFLVHNDMRDSVNSGGFSHDLKVDLEGSFSFGDDDDNNMKDDDQIDQDGDVNIDDGFEMRNVDSVNRITSVTCKKHSQDFDHLISSRGDRILATIKAQGLPTPLTVLVHDGDENLVKSNSKCDNMSIFSMKSTKSLRRSAIKLKQDVKKYMTRFVITEFGENSGKLLTLDMNTTQYMSCSLTSSQGGTERIPVHENIHAGKILSEHPSISFSRDSFIRAICTMRCSTSKWVIDMPRAYILSNGPALTSSDRQHEDMCESPFHHVNDSARTDNKGYEYDPVHRELKITGYIRGNISWNVNSLIHIPNMGTFAVKQIQYNYDQQTSLRGQKKCKMNDQVPGILDENKVFDPADHLSTLRKIGNPLKRESLNMFAAPDSLEGEQNLVGFDTDAFKLVNREQFQPGAARPAGWSDYQASWLDALDYTDERNDFNEDKLDQGELAYDLNRKEMTSAPVDDDMGIQYYDIALRENEKNLLMEQRKTDHKEDMKFPDEVELQRNEKARDRFARYRSIKSFRKSFWDPKENLPDSYATVYHFSSFKATENDVMSDMKALMRSCSEVLSNKIVLANDDGDADERMDRNKNDLLEDMIPPGSSVIITVEGVSEFQYSRISCDGLLVAVSLLPHENKISVIQMGLNQSTQCDVESTARNPIKSKDTLIFRCGWRTWQGRPIFSQNNLNSDKHKFERFMPVNGAFFASSVFGPVTYTPCPVLVFRRNEASGKIEFVAHGTVLGADADRIVVKRIILTGYPTRVHKRHAVVKYMFYDPMDVKWFKPAGLTTKHGLEGTILESVGEHGTMKCLFNAPIKQHDTVCLPLYKRIFPKYAPCETLNDDGTVSKSDILVL